MNRVRFYVGEWKSQQPGDYEGPQVRVSDKAFSAIERHLECMFGGWTVYYTRGSWKGVGETSRVYEVIGDFSVRWAASAFETSAKALKDLAEQESVLYTHEEIEGGFV